MCRILLVQNPHGVDPNGYLASFRHLSKNSQEFQGHGWGCAWLDEQDQWQQYHHIQPVWEDKKSDFPKTRLFLVHARSAFRDEGIVVENNMPFCDGENVFLFNGELRGVRIKAEGRIGAEKIFNYIKRFHKDDWLQTTRKGVDIINKRSRYIRAMNFFLANRDAVQVCSWFNEDAKYFQLQRTSHEGSQIICSRQFQTDIMQWLPIENFSVATL